MQALVGRIYNRASLVSNYNTKISNHILTNIEAFAHIIDLANRTSDAATYEYLMREAQEIMRDKKTEDIDYCDFRQLVSERLENQTHKAIEQGSREAQDEQRLS